MSDFYDLALKAFLDADIDMLLHDIKVVLVDGADYTPNYTTDQYLDDIASAGQVAVSPNLGTKATTAGAFDAGNTTFSSVSGDESEYLVIYRDTGTPSTSPLICLIDSATGLPVTPNGGDINVTWAGSPNYVFRIAT